MPPPSEDSNESKPQRRHFNRIQTLHDLDPATIYSSNTYRDVHSGKPWMKIQHIPHLANEGQAQAILRRIKAEFTSIVERRGWNVTSVTELCCCADGHDTIQKKKLRKVSDNILGYNLTTQDGSHRIHLRLRNPKRHDEVNTDYESIAATMCHELAHCVYRAHNAKFYKLMEEIMEQHALFLVNGGFVVDRDGFPMGGDKSHRLGGNSNHNKTDLVRMAAEKRAQNSLRFGGSRILAGDDAKNADLRHLPPKEAARIAAERRLEQRQREDSLVCLPCNEIVEILDEGNSDDELDSRIMGGIKSKLEENASSLAVRKLRGVPTSDPKQGKRVGTNAHLESKRPRIGDFSQTSITTTSSNNGEFGSQTSSLHRSNPPSNLDSSHSNVIYVNDREGGLSGAECPENGDSVNTSTCFISESPGEGGTTWSCETCTFLNNHIALVCSTCYSIRTVHDALDDRASGAKQNCTNPDINVPPLRRNRPLPFPSSLVDNDNRFSWSCQACTFKNQNNDSFVCVVCGKEDPSISARNLEVIAALRRSDEIDLIKENEAKQSERDFGGFNIYGNKSFETRTMSHLT